MVLLVGLWSVIVEFSGYTHMFYYVINQCLVLSGTSVNRRLMNGGNYYP